MAAPFSVSRRTDTSSALGVALYDELTDAHAVLIFDQAKLAPQAASTCPPTPAYCRSRSECRS